MCPLGRNLHCAPQILWQNVLCLNPINDKFYQMNQRLRSYHLDGIGLPEKEWNKLKIQKIDFEALDIIHLNYFQWIQQYKSSFNYLENILHKRFRELRLHSKIKKLVRSLEFLSFLALIKASHKLLPFTDPKLEKTQYWVLINKLPLPNLETKSSCGTRIKPSFVDAHL